jgi:hypothetical protein
MRTSRRGRSFFAWCVLRKSSAAARAASLRSGEIEYYKSTMTASAPHANAM